MMLIPKRSDDDWFDELFKMPILNHHECRLMKTDIKENKDNYFLIVELPGIEKDDIKIEVEDGYLSIHATKNDEINDDEEKYVRRERHYGQYSRSFYVGKQIETTDIKANFKNGILSLQIPKKDKDKDNNEKKYVQIEE